MKFLKDHPAIRIVLIAVFFLAGMGLTIYGWTLTGQLLGLGLMLIGITLLLTALFVYNRIYK